MAKMVCSILLILLASTEYLYCYECGTHVYDDGEDGIIQSPGFPAPFPDGPYNCTYIITNPYGGDVLLELTDFLTHSVLHTSYWCREKLFVTYVNRQSTQHEPGYPMCHQVPTYQTRAGINTMQVTFQVTDENLYELPGFRAKYYMVSSNYSLMFQLNGTIDMTVSPYQKRNHNYDVILPPEENYTSTIIRLVKSFPGFQVAWSFSGLEQWASQNGSEFILEIRDGPTSMSPLIAEWTNLSQVHNVYSESGYMYIRYTKNYESYFIPGSHIFFRKTYPCPVGFFQCVQSGYCIGSSAVCDGTDHCGDNSDETAPYCGNDLIDTCYGDLPCIGDQVSYECEYDYCFCKLGYEGRKCEYRNFGCKFLCQNGGNCSGYACECPTGSHGDKCEIVCDPPCQNGGTCMYGSCYCLTNYIGNSCENTYFYYTVSLAIVVTILLFIMSIVGSFCVLILCKGYKRRTQTRTRTRTASRSVTPRMRTSRASNTDRTNNRAEAEPNGYVPTTFTPPPTYEWVVNARNTRETTESL